MPPRIVILDGYTLNPGDLDWAPLRALGELTVHARVAQAHAAEHAAGFPLVLTNKVRFPAATLQQLPELRYIGVLATGANNIDLAAARDRGIVVTNVPGYGTASVAQHTIGLILELSSRIGQHDRTVHDGAWSSSPDFCFTIGPTVELEGKTLGIVGLGAIGTRVAHIASALGMHIAAAEHRPGARRVVPGLEVRWLPLDDLFGEADIISLHCPLTEATRALVNARRLARMKPTAFLVNTGRGPLVDEAALTAALQEGRIAGAGLDVLSIEPPAAYHPLLRAPGCVLTPHMAWATRESRRRLLETAAANLEAFLAGRPVNVVNQDPAAGQVHPRTGTK